MSLRKHFFLSQYWMDMEAKPKKSFFSDKERCERNKGEILQIGVRNIERNMIEISIRKG